MARYIDAEKIRPYKGFFEKVDNVPKFYEWLETIPTADVVERKHGKWKHDADGLVWCYRCGFGKERSDERPYNYCPNCGAMMKGETDGI